MKKPEKKRFHLIEFLVVVAIITALLRISMFFIYGESFPDILIRWLGFDPKIYQVIVICIGLMIIIVTRSHREWYDKLKNAIKHILQKGRK